MRLRVAWDDGSGNRLRLQPLSRDSMDRNRREWGEHASRDADGLLDRRQSVVCLPGPGSGWHALSGMPARA